MPELTDAQWRYMHKKMNELTEQVVDLRHQLQAFRPKRYLKFEECVPPASVCKDVCSMLRGIGNYKGFIGKLSEYYGVKTMGCFVDSKLSNKIIAQYRQSEGNAYSRNKSVSAHTVLHEFFHHMHYNDVVVINDSQKEKLADLYATLFLERAEYNDS